MARPADERRQLTVSTTVRDVRAKVLVSEMSYARFLNRGNPVEKTHLRRHDSEEIFGAQIATNIIEEGVRSARMAYEFNADFVDLNCGCPTHEVTKEV